jgi:uncharacterized protein
MSDARVTVAGEELLLLAARVVHWPRQETLLVADPHFGKAAAFRASGVPVPHGTTLGTLGRLDGAIARLAPRRIVFLGDFLHAKEGRAPETVRALEDWRARHRGIAMTLVRGNHDRRAGDPPCEIGIDCVDAPMLEAPFAFAHHPGAVAGHYTLAGHLHPAVALFGPGRQRERVPCYWLGSEVGVLPAFGDFTGVAEVRPRPGDRVFVIAGESVVDVSPVSTPEGAAGYDGLGE